MIKKIKTVLASLAIVAFLGSSTIALAAPYDLEITHRNGTDTIDVPQNLTPPTVLNGTEYFPYFNDTREDYEFMALGSGINVSTSTNTVSVTPSSIETPQGTLVDTLSYYASLIADLTSMIHALGTPFDVNSFMTSNASTTPYIATATSTGFESAAHFNQLAALANPTFAQPSLALNTARQPSTTTPTFVNASVDITTTLSLTGGTAGKVALQEATSSGFTSPITVAQYTNSNTGTLTIGLNTSQIGTASLSAIVPQSYYYRLVTTNVTGTPTYGTPLITETTGI